MLSIRVSAVLAGRVRVSVRLKVESVGENYKKAKCT